MTQGELYKKMFGLGTGSLTSFEIAFNLKQADANPKWAEKGLKTRNYQSVKWNREENVKEVLEEAKKDFPIPNIEFIEDPKLEEFAKGLNKKQLEWFIKWFGAVEGEG